MSAWLHWIGREHYTIRWFVKEAQEYGIARPVSMTTLKLMQWGDLVSCLQIGERGLKSPSMFLEFPIQIISGLTWKAQRAICENLTQRNAWHAVDMGARMVSRRCGAYLTGITMEVEATVKEVADALESLPDGVEAGQPMVGCYPAAVAVLRKPWPVMPDIAFRGTFRLYDRQAAMEEIDAARPGGKRPRLRGQFYIEEVAPKDARAGDLQAIYNYEKRVSA